MIDLLTMDVSSHTEKKNGLTYLSWAWAWTMALKADKQATWEAVEFNGLPCAFLPDGSAMVKTIVTISGHAKSCWLPVMDHRNKAIKNPDAFAVNTAIVRCLTKALSMHGLGLYIYAGEDLPMDSAAPEVRRISAVAGSPDDAQMNEEEQQWLMESASYLKSEVALGNAKTAQAWLLEQALDDTQYTWLWQQLDSKTRSAIDGARKKAA